MNISQLFGRRKRWLISIAVLIAAGSILLINKLLHRQDNTEEILTYAVGRGPLVISIVESGTIQAQERIVIKNTVPGNTTVLWVIDEGSQVKEGDELVKLDASDLEERRFSQQLKVESAEAQFIRSREDYEITQSQASSDIEKAETTLAFARQDLEKYVNGEYPQELREAEIRITLAQEELQRAQETLKWSGKLFEQKFISQTELQADELAEKKAQLNFETAKSEKDLLETHTHKRKLAQLQSDVKQSEMALDRINRKARANILQAKVDMTAKEAEFQRQKDKLAEIDENIKATVVLAPSDGQVVYATSAAQRHWHGNNEPLDAGKSVREQESLIHLPDTTKMMASIKVHETRVKRLSEGMPAVIKIDALPSAKFTGHVNKIAPLPDPTSSWLNPDLKVFDTEVYIDKNENGLRTGMTCEVEIVEESHLDALYAPVQAVVQIGGRPTVYVKDSRGRITPRQIVIGKDNGRMVHILDGIEEGEQVLLTPPLSRSEAPPAQAQPREHDTKKN